MQDDTAASATITVQADALRHFVADLFVAQGVPERDALTVADCLVEANLRGVDTHGVFRAPAYLERLRRGHVNPKPAFKVDAVATCAAAMDADNALGAVAGTHAMSAAIDLARDHGIGAISIRHSNHYGMAAYYVLQAIQAGLIALTFTNASPALPPWGGRRPFFGTSPLAVGVPGGEGGPFVLDMAMTVLARGNVYVAAKHGERIPEGLALDAEGRPTTDPQALIDGGTMLPFGGVKGAALSMLMDILGGVLSGAAFAGRVANPHMDLDRPQDVGHLFLCIQPNLFLPGADFAGRMDELIDRTKAEPKAQGFDEILIPGERESRTRAQRLKTGIPLRQATVEMLRDEGKAIGLAFPG
mgnify:FL=1